MHRLISLTALTLLFTACSTNTDPAEPEAEAVAPEAAEAPSEPTSSVTATADAQWVLANPDAPDGPKMAIISGNPKKGPFMALAKFPAGYTMPVHSHPATFSAVGMSGNTLQGRSSEDNIAITPGMVMTQPADEVHYTGCAADGECVFAVYMDGPMSTTPADAPMEGDMQLVVNTTDQLEYTPVNPDQPKGPQMHIISRDMENGPFRALVKFPAGATSPEHTHTATYSAVVLSGAMSHGGPAPLGAGSFWTTLGGEAHVTGCVSEAPCLFFVSMDGAFDMTPTTPPKADADADE